MTLTIEIHVNNIIDIIQPICKQPETHRIKYMVYINTNIMFTIRKLILADNFVDPNS